MEEKSENMHRINRNRLDSPDNKRVSLFLTVSQLEKLKEYAREARVSYSALVRDFNQKFLDLDEQEWEKISDEISQGIFGTEQSKYKLALVPIESCNEQKLPA